ncbi:MAG: Sec-independent protein translocase protein TatB [Sphingomonadaceae bacterium]
MFELATSELLLIAIVALIVIGPKDLPHALRQLGRAAGKARAMTRHLRAGFDEMVRQAELEEMEKEWRAHNARVMAETAGAPRWPDPEAPIDPMAAPADAARPDGPAPPADGDGEAPPRPGPLP